MHCDSTKIAFSIATAVCIDGKSYCFKCFDFTVFAVIWMHFAFIRIGMPAVQFFTGRIELRRVLYQPTVAVALAKAAG